MNRLIGVHTSKIYDKTSSILGVMNWLTKVPANFGHEVDVEMATVVNEEMETGVGVEMETEVGVEMETGSV